MKLTAPLRTVSKFFYSVFMQIRRYFPRTVTSTFVSLQNSKKLGVSQIHVINLDRQPDRWADVRLELSRILNADGIPLIKSTNRYPAIDARNGIQDITNIENINPFYTLRDQLYVEPQPDALPEDFDLDRPIRMSPAEIAIACSHIAIWKTIAESPDFYTLVLEDDVWFQRSFTKALDQAWEEMKKTDLSDPTFDLLYLSYAEVRYGAPKELLSDNVFRPERGLWYLSGYVLSKKGAQALLKLLPCCGPVDLWINYKFKELEVRALRTPVIHQRADLLSTNSYSILPALTKIGVLDYSSASLFHQKPAHSPVFAFGEPESGLSSLAMALSMLGYRCCSDLDQIPEFEFENLLAGKETIFNAYVNITSLIRRLPDLVLRYPQAKFIVTYANKSSIKLELIKILKGADLIELNLNDVDAWQTLCEHLKMAPPFAPYPSIAEIGVRKYTNETIDFTLDIEAEQLLHDQSPWVTERCAEWKGISIISDTQLMPESRVIFDDKLSDIHVDRWLLRGDTFPGNLGLFRPANVSKNSIGGLMLNVRQESLGVRDFSAAAISSRDSFLYGRFEAVLQATNVSGLVTGFFLYRSSPRQEIDIEITGNRPTHLLVNVFYNPGSEGAKYDYGYRGTPIAIQLGFDASAAPHHYVIEWGPNEIRWLVDGKLVHRRAIWDPTPIPHLPMKLHVNTWPSSSKELAGGLLIGQLPISANLREIKVDAYKANIENTGE